MEQQGHRYRGVLLCLHHRALEWGYYTQIADGENGDPEKILKKSEKCLWEI